MVRHKGRARSSAAHRANATREDHVYELHIERAEMQRALARRVRARYASDGEATRMPSWDPNHLAQLKKGQASWNAWRKANPDITPHLEGVDFTKAEEFRGTEIWGRRWEGDPEPDRIQLWGFDLSSADLRLARLNRAMLVDTNLEHARLEAADLSGANLHNAKLGDADLNAADLSGAFLVAADLSSAHLNLAKLIGAYLNAANLSDADLAGADLSGASLGSSWFLDGDDLRDDRTNLRGANLSNAKCREADFSSSLLCDAYCSSTDFGRANLSDADVSGAVFSYALFEYTDVSRVVFNRAALQGKFKGAGALDTMRGDLRFQEAARESAFISAQWESLGADFPNTLHVTLPFPYEFQRKAGGFRKSVRKWTKLSARVSRYWLSRIFLDAPRAVLSSHVGGAFGTFVTAALSLTLGFVIVVLIAAVIDSEARSTGFEALVRGDLAAAGSALAAGRSFAFWGALGATTGLILGGWYARVAFVLFWSLLDFGRSWVRVMVMAGALVGLFGGAYQLLNHKWIEFIVSSDLSNAIASGGLGLYPSQHWFYPWYVAAMGFCTLGIGDMIAPLNGAGQVLIIANVVAGFVTLGLLLAVLTDQFSSKR